MAVGFLRRSVRGEVSSHSVRPACLGHRVSTKTLCLLGQPKKAIGSKSPIGPWLATLPSTCLQVSRTEWRRQKTQMEPQGWRTPPLLQSTKRTRTAVLKKTTRTESVHVQAVGLDAGNLPGTEPVERSFLLTSPFIGPNGIAFVCFVRGSPNTSQRRSRKVRTCSSRAASSAARTNVETAKAKKPRLTGRRSGAFAPMSSASSIAANPNRKLSPLAPTLRITLPKHRTQRRSSVVHL